VRVMSLVLVSSATAVAVVLRLMAMTDPAPIVNHAVALAQGVAIVAWMLAIGDRLQAEIAKSRKTHVAGAYLAAVQDERPALRPVE